MKLFAIQLYIIPAQPASAGCVGINQVEKVDEGGSKFCHPSIRPSVHPSIKKDPPRKPWTGSSHNMSDSEAIPRDIRSKGTSELCFCRIIDFRGCESVVKDNVEIPCLGMCSHRLREHFWHLLQAELCLRCSLNSLIRQL